jgi:hypothetical protein
MSKKAKAPERSQLKFLGESIIVFGNENQCLGDLMHFQGHGTFDPYYGRVDVTKEEAEIHNKAFGQARLEGLDKNCKVGQGSSAYLTRNKGTQRCEVTDFVGTVISTDVNISTTTITFRRKGMTFRGKMRKDSDNFNYRRVS